MVLKHTWWYSGVSFSMAKWTMQYGALNLTSHFLLAKYVLNLSSHVPSSSLQLVKTMTYLSLTNLVPAIFLYSRL